MLIINLIKLKEIESSLKDGCKELSYNQLQQYPKSF